GTGNDTQHNVGCHEHHVICENNNDVIRFMSLRIGSRWLLRNCLKLSHVPKSCIRCRLCCGWKPFAARVLSNCLASAPLCIFVSIHSSHSWGMTPGRTRIPGMASLSLFNAPVQAWNLASRVVFPMP